MNGSYLKILMCALIALFMVFGSMSLTITATPSGLAYAQPPPGQIGQAGQPPSGHVGPPPGQRHSSSPDPTPWLLFVTEAGGLILFRKKFKK